MSNGINKRQNEIKSIQMLAAQRQLYSNNKKVFYFGAVFSVFVPFVLSLVSIYSTNIHNVQVFLYGCSLMSLVITVLFEGNQTQKKNIAALIQQQFDIYVYNMEWNNEKFGRNRNVDGYISKYSEKIMANKEARNQLRNWYNKEADNMPLNDGIFACQRENCYWDVALRKRTKIICIFFAVLPLVIFSIINLIRQEELTIFFGNLFILVPVLIWIIATIKKLNQDISRLENLDSIISDMSPNTMDKLIDIQGILYEHRKEAFVIPDVIYWICRHIDEYEQGRLMKMSK